MSVTKGMLSSVTAVLGCENLSLIQDYLKTVYTATEWTHVEIFEVENFVGWEIHFQSQNKKNSARYFELNYREIFILLRLNV